MNNNPNLQFSDRPLPPRNIVVADIKADSCYLTWDAPEDNGGSEITNYILERRDASKKKSDFEVLTIHLIDRRYGVSQGHEEAVLRLVHLHNVTRPDSEFNCQPNWKHENSFKMQNTKTTLKNSDCSDSTD